MAPSEIKSKKWNFNNLFSYLDDGQFADFKVHCKGHVFRVHRLVLCQKSKYFAALNKDDWTVGAESLRYSLLTFLYRGRYPETDIAAYGVKQFSQLNDPYKMAGNVEFLHAQMYALASKLGIQELFDVSRAAFQRRYSHLNCHTRDNWVALVGFIYNSTKPEDDDLRKIVLHGLQHALAYDHPTIHDGNLADVLKVVSELAYDALTTKISRKTQIWCIQCTEYQTLVLDRCAHGFAVDCTKACCREALSNTECMTCGCTGMTGNFDG